MSDDMRDRVYSVDLEREDLPKLDRSIRRQLSGWRSLTFGVSASVLIAAVVGLLLASVLLFPYLLVRSPSAEDLDSLKPAERIAAKNSLAQTRNAVRTTLVQAIGGGLFLVTAYLGWRQVQTARQGQLTDRFTKTIDQLGSDKADVRLGGIYALRQMAANSAYTRPIAEIFAAYLRTHSLRSSSDKSKSSSESDQSKSESDASKPASDEPKSSISSTGGNEGTTKTDLQAVLRILITEDLWGKANAGRLDLSFIAVPYAELYAAHLKGCILLGADLSHADLRQADMQESDMRGVRLSRANLSRANLTSADLTGGELAGVELAEARLMRIQAKGVNLARARLTLADATLADLEEANLTGSTLTGAILIGTRLVGAQLESCNLSRADLTRANLSRANLGGADLSGATLVEVNLAGTKTDSRTRFDDATLDAATREQLAHISGQKSVDSPVEPSRSSVDKVLIVHSNKDRAWLERLQTTLRPLEHGREVEIETWSDAEIRAGENWRQRLLDELASVSVCLVVITPNLLASDFAEWELLPRLLPSVREQGVLVIPVIVESPAREQEAELERSLASLDIRSISEPLVSLDESDRTKALASIFDRVKDAVDHRT